MERKIQCSFLTVALVVTLAGCEETAKHPIQVRPDTPLPAEMVERAQPLPLPPPPPAVAYLITEPRPAVDRLIARVEADFEAGEREYKAGNLEKAREDFERAVDLILTSGFEVRTDPRLRELFDRIVDAVHDHELEATREAENAEEPTGEPAPIEEIAGLELPAGDPRLAQKAEQELITVWHDLPLTVNESVLSYLSFFQTPRGRAIVETGLRRAGRYRDMIQRGLKKEGLPQDLLYLAQAESAFKPLAVSRAGARGIWQFMPFRGREYDLRRTKWVDERNDPEKATHAAAHHLRDLYEMFGDWYLVMAAYNSGPLNVVRAIEQTGYADFWELRKRNALPRETKNYVPIILALTLIAKDPVRYGIHVQPDKSPHVDVVKPGHPIDLRLVADMVDLDVATLRSLNPELIRYSTPDDSDFELRLPEASAEKFRKETALIPPEKWLSWRRHRVREGETLSSLARHYHLSPAAIAAVNRLEAEDPLEVGVKLTIPTATPAPGRLVRYRVQRGDTLEGIAARFDATVEEIKRWNHLRGYRAPRGARLKIYAGGEGPTPLARLGNRTETSRNPRASQSTQKRARDREAVHHRVRPGETLSSIAQAYRTTVAALRQANPFLVGRPLQAGDLLIVLHPR